jgi:uncharacterized protein (DUF1810 family)
MTSLDSVARTAANERTKAHAEMKAGQKKGHWVWWVFPTLKDRGGDMNSAFQKGADLPDVATAIAYAKHPELREQLLETLRVASAAFAAAEASGHGQGPWRVLDKGFGRSSDGQWVSGPVDAFKAFCSCTLFAAVAHSEGDEALKAAAIKTLSHFSGDIVYTAGKRGTAGFVDGGSPEALRTVLKGYDSQTLAIVGGDWAQISAGARA